ncbi:hypothetical protein BBJ28_00007329 [Nothophytophthora sp. Chile5]|nr:hypothetical protein BBJ28_00007329 [Nothophytophthora sp. Chile5]
MEKWRSVTEPKAKLVLLVLSSVALGGCGIWCMHFTGMTALQLTREDGSILPVDFEAGLTVLSFLSAVLGVFVGLKIASTDPFFLEMEQEERKNLLVRSKAFDLLRVGSALAMGIAVCGSHYSGMCAASYTYAAGNVVAGGIVLKGSQAALVSSHGAVLYCYWVMTWSVASSVRNIVAMTSNASNPGQPTPAAQKNRVASHAKGGESFANLSEMEIEEEV